MSGTVRRSYTFLSRYQDLSQSYLHNHYFIHYNYLIIFACSFAFDRACDSNVIKSVICYICYDHMRGAVTGLNTGGDGGGARPGAHCPPPCFLGKQSTYIVYSILKSIINKNSLCHCENIQLHINFFLSFFSQQSIG